MGNTCTKSKEVSPFLKNVVVQQTRKKTGAKKAIPKAMKRLVWDTYIGEDVGKAKCLCCNHSYIRQIEFHCGHVIAEANGGKITLENLRPICAQCNLSMRTTNMDEFKKMFERA